MYPGSLRCWGNNQNAQLTKALPLLAEFVESVDVAVNVKMVATGAFSTCILTHYGAVRCFGANSYGQLGDGTTIDRGVLLEASVLMGATFIGCGWYFCCAITSANSGLFCWGQNDYGQLGVGNTTPLSSPPSTSVLNGTSTFSGALSHACAVVGGGCRCWGSNVYGALGTGNNVDTTVPPATSVLSNTVSVAVGAHHSCAITGSYQLYCWGSSFAGQLGTGLIPSLSPTIVAIAPVTQVSSSLQTVCALQVNGTVSCWGSNSQGQTGVGPASATTLSPTNVLLGARFVAVGHEFSCAVMQSNGVRCWGYSLWGALGNSGQHDVRDILSGPILSGISSAAVGQLHACSRSGGQVQCWGKNDHGQIGVSGVSITFAPSGTAILPDATRIAAGAFHTCALVVSGTRLTCWGYNAHGQLGVGSNTDLFAPPPILDVVVSQVACGAHHTCVLDSAAKVRCWGFNAYGQLGLGTTIDTKVPGAAVSSDNMLKVAAGVFVTCAVRHDFGLRCWGDNGFGQLGMGTSGNILHTYPASSVLADVASMATGYHTCAVAGLGSGLYCWGQNYAGELGDGTYASRNQPPSVPVLIGVQSVAVGHGHTCALTDLAELYCFGSNYMGILGNSSWNVTVPQPVVVFGPGSTSFVTAGAFSTCAVKSGGNLVCWGWNGGGQMGTGQSSSLYYPPTLDTVVPLPTPSPTSSPSVSPSTTASLSPTPTRTSTPQPSENAMRSVSVGAQHVCAVQFSGGLRCWGQNKEGQIGVGDSSIVASFSPPANDILSNVLSVTCGDSHTCAIYGSWSLTCWGANSYGQLGDGSTVTSWAPSSTPILVGVKQVTAGAVHTCAIVGHSNSLHCWGRSNSGQVGSGLVTPVLSPPVDSILVGCDSVTAGSMHTCALKDGGVVCWGSNAFGQLGDGGSLNVLTIPVGYTPVAIDVSSVSAGVGHTCIVRFTGSVSCWGANTYGQLSDVLLARSTPGPDILFSGSTVAKVAAGGSSTCVLSASGSVRCWGMNNFGQLGDGSTNDIRNATDAPVVLENVAELEVGSYGVCAVQIDGRLKCWGYNNFGVLGTNGNGTALSPIEIPAANQAKAISVGWAHSCLVTSEGKVQCTGWNRYGQLGTGDTNGSVVYTDLSGGSTLSNVAQVLAGGSHSCAVSVPQGNVSCWGDNEFYQLGTGDTTDQLVPVPVSPSVTVNASLIFGGTGHVCAASTAGGVWCWGTNSNGQVGDGTTVSRSVPTLVSLAAVASGSGGAVHTCIVTVTNELYCWGRNVNGQIGDNTLVDKLSPTLILSGVKSVSCGGHHTAVITVADLGLKLWGRGVSGQLGTGSTSDVRVPGPNLFTGVMDVAAGSSHTCALLGSRDVKCWGMGTFGAVGDGARIPFVEPTANVILSNVVKIFSGCNAHGGCAVFTNGSVACWGNNVEGGLGSGDMSDIHAPSAGNPIVFPSPSQTPSPSISVSPSASLSLSVTASLSLSPSSSVSPSVSPSQSPVPGHVVQLSIGLAHMCAVIHPASVRCWGSNSQFQLGTGTTAPVFELPFTNTAVDVYQVSAGRQHTCVIIQTSNGLRCWGNNDFGQLGDGSFATRHSVPTTDVLTSVWVVSASDHYFTCIVYGSFNGVTCFGQNSVGQLGDGSFVTRAIPSFSILNGTRTVVSGSYHACAILHADGTVKCWGFNSQGQLGDNSVLTRSSPTTMLSASSVTSLGLGFLHTCVAFANGSVACVGSNDVGALGVGSSSVSIPVVVDALSGVSQVAARGFQSCALLTNSSMYCWGSNEQGVLGDGTVTMRSRPMGPVVSGVAQISLGEAVTCAIMLSGGLRCWGDSEHGLLGTGHQNVPQSTLNITGVQSVSCGVAHTCITKGNGVFCWGSNLDGQLGVGTLFNSYSPPAVAVLTTVRQLSAGDFHTCAVMISNGMRCWGRNNEGQLGIGSLVSLSTPLPYDTLSNVGKVASSAYHTCALYIAGSLTCFGQNLFGQLGDGTVSAKTSPPSPILSGVGDVSTGMSVSCAVLVTNSGLICWGRNTYGQLGLGTFSVSVKTPPVSPVLTGVAKVMIGGGFVCALLNTTGVRCWGRNGDGQLGYGTGSDRSIPPLEDVVLGVLSGSCREAFCCVVLFNATVRCWGVSVRGEFGSLETIGTHLAPLDVGMTNVAQFFAGFAHGCVISASDASLSCFGWNEQGQVGVRAGFEARLPPETDMFFPQSASPAASPSRSGTVTSSPSLSVSASRSPTRSLSASVTGSTSVTSSVTGSRTASISASSSVSDSLSVSHSASVSLSSSQSTSGTGTVSESSTSSASFIPSPSPSSTGTVSLSVSSSMSISMSGSVSSTPSASPSVTSSVSVSSSVSPTLSESSSASLSLSQSMSISRSSSVSLTSSSSLSATSSVSVSPSVSPTLSESGSVSLSRSSSKSFSASISLSPTSSTSVSASASNTASVTLSRSVTASVTVTPSPTSSPCPIGCSSCNGFNCSECKPGYRTVFQSPIFICTAILPLAGVISCSITENAVFGAVASCPSSLVPGLTSSEVALTLATFSSAGERQPFSLSSNSWMVTVVDSSAIDYERVTSFNVTVSVCMPQHSVAFVGGRLTPVSCASTQHVMAALWLVVSVNDVNEPPLFRPDAFAFSTPAVTSSSAAVGFPLQANVIDPDISNSAWKTVRFTEFAGLCGSPSTQLLPAMVSSGFPPSPLVVDPVTAQLKYASSVSSGTVTRNVWKNPTSLCVVATDGGGLTAAANVSVTFTDVAASLSVFPLTINETHYGFGTRVIMVSVSFYAGSQAGLTWNATVGLGTSWLSVVSMDLSSGTVSVLVNTSSLSGQYFGSWLQSSIVVNTSGVFMCGVWSVSHSMWTLCVIQTCFA
jgi:alpha-tubulin suppressor-like RCC1 family protein